MIAQLIVELAAARKLMYPWRHFGVGGWFDGLDIVPLLSAQGLAS
jgi:hypothetical protein